MRLRLLCCLLLASSLTTPAPGQNPYDEANDPSMALHKPDEYAWRLFVALNWPADLELCSADASKSLGDNRPVVWQT
jgi:hypothetical protein